MEANAWYNANDILETSPDSHARRVLGNSGISAFVYLITGEEKYGRRAIDGALDAAPYTLGTHFKDHTLERKTSPLHYEIGHWVLGSGDAELEECYRIIKEKSPYKNELVMLLEMFKGCYGILA